MSFVVRHASYAVWFWIIFGITSLCGIAFSIHYFSRAFPLVTVDLTMDRAQALKTASLNAHELQIGPESFQQAALFYTDELAKLYIEFEAGDANTFKEIVARHIYEPYVWQVRHFEQGSKHEATFIFTPSGQKYGFLEVIPETVSGAALTSQEAQNIGQAAASEQWGINFNDYKLVDASQEVMLSKRVDHAFTYEKINEQIGKATYRLRVMVRGDKLSGVLPFVKVPEEFIARYTELRSANQGIAMIAGGIFLLVYLLGGCGFGLAFLVRNRSALWKPTLVAAFVVSALNFLANLNQMPLLWMHYPTALGMNQFLIKNLIIYIFGFLVSVAMLSVIFVTSEGLTRKAFKAHPQFWRVWESCAASSYGIVGRTAGGYLLVGFMLAFIVALYSFSIRYLGWWIPSDHLTNPNILSTYFPWLNAVASSLHAGFMEECGFRALPIAAAAILGNRFGKRSWWIAGAVILQAVVFGAMHATYPALPAYARLIELIIPSFMFAAVYLKYGLLPVIITHAVFDLVLFSIPLFVADAAGAWVNQALVILIGLVPAIMVIIAIIRRGGMHKLSEDYSNAAWQPVAPTVVYSSSITEPVLSTTVSHKARHILFAIAVIIGVIGFLVIKMRTEDSVGITVSRGQAIELAKHAWQEKGVVFDSEWRALGVAYTGLEASNTLQHKFVWQHGGKPVYQNLIHSYLLQPRFVVRFVRFERPVAERAEEYQAVISGDGKIRRMVHILPEDAAGKYLSEQDARDKVVRSLQITYQLDSAQLEEISVIGQQRPHRQDWVFVFADKQAYDQSGGQARISVTVQGDEIADSEQFIYLPDEWVREQSNIQETRNSLRMVSLLAVMLVFFILLFMMRGPAVSYKTKILVFGGVFGVFALDLANKFAQTEALFGTKQTYMFQLFSNIGVGLFSSIILALLGTFFVLHSIAGSKRNSFALPVSQAILIGGALAMSMTGFVAIGYKLFPLPLPTWGNYQHVIFSVQSLGVIINSSIVYLLLTSIMLFIVRGLNSFQHKISYRTGLLFGVCMFVGVIGVGAISPYESLYRLLMQGVVAGLVLYMVYKFFVQYDARIVVVMTWFGVVLGAVTNEMLNIGPTPGLFVAILVSGFLCYLLVRALHAKQSNVSVI